MKTHAGIRLFIGTDNEGGNVFWPPRGDYASFPGNMALAAAIEGADEQLAVEQGKLMARICARCISIPTLPRWWMSTPTRSTR